MLIHVELPGIIANNMLILYNTVVRSTLTKTPSNVVVEAGTNVTLECSSDRSASSITWRHESVGNIAVQCSSSHPRFITTSNGNDCYLTALGNYSVQGLYGCIESGQYAEAAVIVIGKLVLLRVKLQG